MQEFIRLTQTGNAIGTRPEMHEDTTDVTGMALNSVEVTAIKNSLTGKMVSANSKFEKHYHDHDELSPRRCRMEDLI